MRLLHLRCIWVSSRKDFDEHCADNAKSQGLEPGTLKYDIAINIRLIMLGGLQDNPEVFSVKENGFLLLKLKDLLAHDDEDFLNKIKDNQISALITEIERQYKHLEEIEYISTLFFGF